MNILGQSANEPKQGTREIKEEKAQLLKLFLPAFSSPHSQLLKEFKLLWNRQHEN